MPVARMAQNNTQFRDVIWTGRSTQLVLMAVPEHGEIGGEVHEGHDQLLYFVSGSGRAEIGDDIRQVGAGDVAIVPAGTFHNVVNTGDAPLKLHTTYAPPEHAPGTEHDTKADANVA